jgi:chemotaxis protein methyltransferase CheR
MLAADTGYECIRDWLCDHCGMSFPEKKRDLLTHRMAKVQERFGLSNLGALASELTKGDDVDLKLAVIHAASTNHTYFFREPQALDFFRDKILTAPCPGGGLRVWSAAASSGDEAYSLAIVAAQMFGAMAPSRVSILGTDISLPAISQAELALYSTNHLEHVPSPILERYFTPAGMGQYQIVPDIRRLCTFRRLNLKSVPYPFTKGFHVVFCRNILYYFDRQHQFQILEQLYDVTEPGGWLLTSVTEVVRDLRTRWQPVSNAIYRRPQ